MSHHDDPGPDTLHCVCCGEPRARAELDRLLWCEPCVERARAAADRKGWLVGLALGAVTAGWIWGVLRPSSLVLGGWVATV
ncbi:MAG: hypothetical protein D6701_05690, partial [Gemmatimonadetes bacterium]